MLTVTLTGPSNSYFQATLIRLLFKPKADFASGNFEKRPKSPSVEQSINPCSMASEARWASGTRFACIPEPAKNDHLNDSPSAIARTSVTLSRFAIRQGPRSTERVWKLLRFFTGPVILLLPSLSTRLSNALHFKRRVFARRLSAAATSFSKVIVVRTPQKIVYLISLFEPDFA